MQYCCVAIPPAAGEAYWATIRTLLWIWDSLSVDDVRTNWPVRATMHTKGGQAQTRLHESWLRGIEKPPLILFRQGIGPRVFGLEFRRFTHRATPPVLVTLHAYGYATETNTIFNTEKENE